MSVQLIRIGERRPVARNACTLHPTHQHDHPHAHAHKQEPPHRRQVLEGVQHRPQRRIDRVLALLERHHRRHRRAQRTAARALTQKECHEVWKDKAKADVLPEADSLALCGRKGGRAEPSLIRALPPFPQPPHDPPPILSLIHEGPPFRMNNTQSTLFAPYSSVRLRVR